jgi:ribulose kinase
VVDELTAAGGLTANRLLLRIYADVLGRRRPTPLDSASSVIMPNPPAPPGEAGRGG